MSQYEDLLNKANGNTLDKRLLDKELFVQLTSEGVSQNKIVKLFGFTDYEIRQLIISFGLDKESAKKKYIDNVCREFGEQARRALASCSYYERHKKVSNRKKETAVNESVDIIESLDNYIAEQIALYGETFGIHLRAVANFENRAAHLKAQVDKEDCLRWATADDLIAIKARIKTTLNIVREPHTKDERSESELAEVLDNQANKVAVYGYGGEVWGYAVITDGADNSLEILDFVVFFKELKFRPTPGMLLKKIDECAAEKGVYTIKYKMDDINGLDKSFKVNKYDFQDKADDGHLLKITSPIGEKYFAEIAIEKERLRLLEVEANKKREEQYLREREQRKKEQQERDKQTYRLIGVKLKGPESYVEKPVVIRDGKGNISPAPYRSDIYKMLVVNQGSKDAIEKMWRILSPKQLDTLLNIDYISNQSLAELFHVSLSSIDKKISKLGVGRTFGDGLCLDEGEYFYKYLSPDEEYLQSISDQRIILETENDD